MCLYLLAFALKHAKLQEDNRCNYEDFLHKFAFI